MWRRSSHPTTCTTMAMSGAVAQARTRSSCWVTTCSCSSARSTTRAGAGGAGLPPVTQAGRTGDQPGESALVTAWFLQRRFDVVLKRGGYRESGRDDAAEASHRDDRQEHVGDLVLGGARC